MGLASHAQELHLELARCLTNNDLRVCAYNHYLMTGNSEILSFSIIDLNIGRYVTFVTHGPPHSKNHTLILKPARCKTTSFQASFFNSIVKPWNIICNLAPHDKFSSLSMFNRFLCATYFYFTGHYL